MIDPISTTALLPAALPPTVASPSGGSDFSHWLSAQVEGLNTQLTQADTEVRQLAVGDSANVHQVMIDLEKAKLSLELVVQVRNKLMEAYQNVMQMQV